MLEGRGTFDAQFSPDGHTLAVKAGDVVRLWNVDTGVPAALLKELPKPQDIWFISDDRALVTGSDGMMRLWNTGTDTLVTALPRPPEEISPDGQILATTHNGLVQLWSSRTGMLIATLDRISDQSFPQFSPDGRTVGIINMDDTLLLWSVPRP